MIPISIKIQPTTDLKLSVWFFDPPNLVAGEQAEITGIIMAHETNPLYQVTRSNGKTFAVHHSDLVECGALR